MHTANSDTHSSALAPNFNSLTVYFRTAPPKTSAFPSKITFKVLDIRLGSRKETPKNKSPVAPYSSEIASQRHMAFDKQGMTLMKKSSLPLKSLWIKSRILKLLKLSCQ